MLLDIRTRNIELSSALLDQVERRLRAAFGRLRHRIRQVKVRLAEVSGVRGAADTQCRIIVHMVPSGHVVVDSVDADAHAAVGRALERTGRHLRRALRRLRDDARRGATRSVSGRSRIT